MPGLTRVRPDLDAEDEKTQQETLKQEFTPLIDWIKEKFAGIIKDGLSPIFLVTAAFNL